jgi:hypothetical protein
MTAISEESDGTDRRKLWGAVGAVGEWSPQGKPSHKKSQAETSERKEQRHTDRLFGTNSLKEGTM